MAQASSVSRKSSVKELFTKLWVGRMKGSQQGRVTHWRVTISRPEVQGREWSVGPERTVASLRLCLQEMDTDSYMAFRKGMQPLPTYDSEGREPGRSTPHPLPFDLLPVPGCLNHTGARGQRGPRESSRSQSIVEKDEE